MLASTSRHTGAATSSAGSQAHQVAAITSSPNIGHLTHDNDLSQPEQINASLTEVEVAGMNRHTHSREFHGQTSSMAFLAALHPESGRPGAPEPRDATTSIQGETLVSTFHNDAFSPLTPTTTAQEDSLLHAERFYFRHSRLFLEGHFQNIHFVHPIIDKVAFTNRCEDLWFGRENQQPKSFIALYYSIMSLGALVRTWDDGETIDGAGRLKWSRKLFNLARLALIPLKMSADLETIQSYFFLAKVCQNELNPSLAYMFLGLATRASFTAGINRQQRSGEAIAADEDQEAAQRTWWGLYSLEVELSFALGRPDSLGPDQYHNRILPQKDKTETAIIPALVYLARIIRRVCTHIYLSEGPLDTKVNEALKIEEDMDVWVSQLPVWLSTIIDSSQMPNKIVKEPQWSKLQRLVLGIRYYNVKMILLRPFLAREGVTTQHLPPVLSSIIHRCVDAGRITITLMHDIYVNQPFFRTWWYNTTYVLYAASIVLWYTINTASAVEIPALLNLGDQAVDILEAMEESVVARKACHLIKEVVFKAREKFNVGTFSNHEQSTRISLHCDASRGLESVHEAAGGISLEEMNLNLDFFDMIFPMDEMQSFFWTDSSGHPL